MKNFTELVFLKELPGVGPARIIKHYLPMLEQGIELTELRSFAKESESKLSQENISLAYDKALLISEQYEKESDVHIVTLLDRDFPKKLRVLENKCPVFLFYKGNLSIVEEKSIAIVGTREPSEWSQRVEKNLTNRIIELSERVIISGLAQGCDTIAHRTCIDSGGKTVAVLPCGINNIFPEENKNLSEEIVNKDGLLITEYFPNSAATQYTFVERDRLIAAASDATFVVECGIKSGTMHTVDSAEKIGKKIAAFYSDDAEKGNYTGNKLVIDKKGASMVTDTESLKEFLNSLNDVGMSKDVQMSFSDYFGENI